MIQQITIREEWARLAKKAGYEICGADCKASRWICLFDSALTDYKRQIQRPDGIWFGNYLDAFRAEGLKVGLLLYTDLTCIIRTIRNTMICTIQCAEMRAYKDENINYDRYLEYMHGQVEELVTNYGKLDILWFDFSL